MGPTAHRLNRLFDRFVRREVRWRGRSIRSFQVCGLTGFAVAIVLGVALAIRLGLSPWILAGLTLAAVTTFVVLAFATKILIGCETLIYYHHEIAIFAVCGTILYGSHLPVFTYLDVMAIGVGSVLAGGRVGCLMAACCHGRPHVWGVRYARIYAGDGFCERFIGVRLFPIQLVEFICVTSLVAVCFAVAYSARQPGAAFLLYVAVYAVIRFTLEVFRGDAGRRIWLGFSEAQWTSCVLTSATLFSLTHWAWLLPFAMAAAGLVLRQFDEQRRLFQAAHLVELAGALERSRNAGNTPVVVGTSLGVRISTGIIREAGAVLTNYSISRAGKGLTERNARALCGSVALIDGADGSFESWIKGTGGVFHLVVRAQR